MSLNANTHWILLMISLAALAAAAAVQVPPPPGPPPRQVQREIIMVGGPERSGELDANGDGQITRDEFLAPLAEHFARLDADGDGRVSVEELRAPPGPGGSERTMTFHHGGPTPPEGMGEGEEIAPGVRRFEWTSPDGGERRVVMIRAEGGPGAPPPPPPHPPMPPLPPGGDAAQLDADGDGRVSQAEFIAPLAEAFARADADNSGYLEEGERAARRIHIVRREETR